MQGVVILSLKKASYACAAFNLALSIKYHNPKIHITLISDGEHLKHYSPIHYSVFDWIKEIEPKDYIDKGIFQPGLAKLKLNNYSTYKQSLYIDADSICLKDLQPLFDRLSGSSFKSNQIDGYTQWTDEETYKEQFGIPFGKTINTSFIYWEKIDVFAHASAFYRQGFPIDKVLPAWGKTYPDELFFNAAITKHNIDANCGEPFFFGNAIDVRTFDEIEHDHYCFSMAGNKSIIRKIYIDWYDRLMFKICASKGIEHRFKSHQILVDKHVNQ